MSDDTARSGRGPRAGQVKSTGRREWIAAGVVLAGVVTLLALRPWAPKGGGKAPRVSAAQAPAASPVMVVPPPPPFGRSDEAARYREAVIAGDERSIALVDRALGELARQSTNDPQQIEKLKQLRSERLARLSAYRAAAP